METQTRTYCPVSRADFEAIRSNLSNAGVNLPDADSGSVPAPHGFTVGWQWTHVLPPNKPYLRIDLTGGAFFSLAWGAIEAHVKPFIGKFPDGTFSDQ